MNLCESWKAYEDFTACNYSVLPEKLKCQGQQMVFPAQSVLVLRGDFPEYIYFILSGHVRGQRSHLNGDEYVYFQLDSSNGNIGLLEVFSRKEQYVATIFCATEVTTVRIPSAVFYRYVMEDRDLLRRCLTLVAQDLYRSSGKDGLYYYMEGIDRVRSYLVDYYAAHTSALGGGIELREEYHQIAAKLGISVRTVGRSLRLLRENGEISTDRRKTIITQAGYKQMLGNILV